MKVSLLFPPEYNTLWMPYSSLPSLTGYLRRAGVNTEQHDWNLDIHEEIFNPKNLQSLWENTDWQTPRKASYPGVPDRAQIVERLRERIGETIEGITESINIMRDPEKFFDKEAYVKSHRIINDAILLTAIAGWDLEEILRSPSEALNSCLDPKFNVFSPYLEEKTRNLIENKPDVVGISVMLPRQLAPALAIAKLVKRSRPETHVTVGGTYVTMISHAVENSPDLFDVFDSVALSEGELALLGIVNAAQNGSSLADVPGILYRSNGKVSRTSLPVMVDADELPAMDFDGLPLRKYLSPETVLPAFSSRGCHWRRCSFCARPDRKGFSQRSPEKVVKDIGACMKKYGARTFHFYDNSVRARRLAAIADALVDAGHEVIWTARTRFNPEITPEWAERVAAGGLSRIIFGMESASKRVLDLMQKGFRVEEIPTTLQALSKAGIDATLYLMVGFPTETKDEAAKTLGFIENLSQSMTPYAQYYVSPFGLAHSSHVHKEPQQFSITTPPQWAPDDLRNPYCFEFGASTGMSRPEMSATYVQFREKLSVITTRPIEMPHDMLMKRHERAFAPEVKKALLRMESVLKLAEDLRAEKGYLKKGSKKFRIDENLGALIELLGPRKNMKQILTELASSGRMNMANAFIFVQQLFEEGVIATEDTI